MHKQILTQLLKVKGFRTLRWLYKSDFAIVSAFYVLSTNK